MPFIFVLLPTTATGYFSAECKQTHKIKANVNPLYILKIVIVSETHCSIFFLFLFKLMATKNERAHY